MARKRISEYRAKKLLYNTLGNKYSGFQINDINPLIKDSLDYSKKYIAKVDQGVKGRYKKGLIKNNISIDSIDQTLKEFREKGFSQFLIEEMIAHKSEDEKYLSIERTKEGYKLLYSDKGGIDIELHQHAIKSFFIDYRHPRETRFNRGENGNPEDGNIRILDQVRDDTQLDVQFLQSILASFDRYYLSFLEINPFIISNSKFRILDAAVEVDSTAEFFVNNAWTSKDFIEKQKDTDEEENVKKLAEKSQAAFSLEVLNPNGSIFMMLSGGGASIVLADETHNQGLGTHLANYGEYSGNPSAEESYIYAQNILSLLIKSKAPKKALIIAGGVANFTDVRITFKGLIKAMDQMKEELQRQKMKVFVRRGGPHQKEGLAQMKSFLERENLLGIVAGPEMILTDIVTEAIKYLI